MSYVNQLTKKNNDRINFFFLNFLEEYDLYLFNFFKIKFYLFWTLFVLSSSVNKWIRDIIFI